MYIKQCLNVVTAIVAATSMNGSSSRADLIITIPDVVVSPGGSGFLDVIVSSNGTDSFQNYFLDFSVNGPAQAASPINFVESAIPPISAPQVFESNYIFFDDSAEAVSPIGIDFASESSLFPGTNDLINVMDETDSFADRTIALADGEFLLARLNFVAPLNATPGNVYDVSLDFDPMDLTEFLDEFGDPVVFTPPSSGSITISAAAVPEPSTFAVMGCGLGCFLIHRRRKRRELGMRSGSTS